MEYPDLFIQVESFKIRHAPDGILVDGSRASLTAENPKDLDPCLYGMWCRTGAVAMG